MSWDINRALEEGLRHHNEAGAPRVTVFVKSNPKDTVLDAIIYETSALTVYYDKDYPNDMVQLKEVGEVDIVQGYVVGFVFHDVDTDLNMDGWNTEGP